MRRHLLFLSIASLAAWSASALMGGFSFDDLEVLAGNPVIDGDLPWFEAFRRDYWQHHPAGAAGHYRPLATLSLRWDTALWGRDPRGFHLTNVVMHLAVVLLSAGLFCGRHRLPTSMPWIGLTVLAVHPVLANSVAWISGRTSMLAALPALLAANALLRTRAHWIQALCACFGTGLAILGKEDGVIAALALPLVVWAGHGPKRSRMCAAGCLAGLVLALVLRQMALGDWFPTSPSAPLAHTPLPQRLLVAGAAALHGLAALLRPWESPPTQVNLSELQAYNPCLALAPWVLWGLALSLSVRSALRGSVTSVFTSLALLVALVYAQVIPSGELFAPRFLYLPLVLLVPGMHQVILPLLQPPICRWSAMLLALFSVSLCWSEAQIYESRRSYWEAVLIHEPRSALAWNALGNSELSEGSPLDARHAWRRAIELDPGYSRPWVNLGTAAMRDEDWENAISLLSHAIELSPENPVAWLNLGNAYLRTEDWEQAATAYEQACKLSPGAVPAWRGLGRSLFEIGHIERGQWALDRAIALSPADPLTLRVIKDGPPGD